MARSSTERRIIERRKARGILVPILEEVLDRPLDVKNQDDFDFLLDLMQRRAEPREKGVFSPSMLSSCMRKSYFAKTGQKKVWSKSPRTNGFFLDGNFRHLKWQFALWKAHQSGLLILHGVEVRVFHPNGDYAGTIDAIVEINGEFFIVDFKGMNVNSFQNLESYGAEFHHRVQIVGYAMIANQTLTTTWKDNGKTFYKDVTHCLLIGENKGGPTQKGSPIALHEDIVEVAKYKKEVKTRITQLRRAVADEKIPEPACTSTRNKGFQECPFAWFCREEVKAIQRERESANGRNADEREVATPSSVGANRSNRRTSGRKKRPA